MKSKIDGIRKAAILVTSLDRSAADRVLEHMSPEQERKIRQAMIELDEIDPEEQARIVEEFFRVKPMMPREHHPGIELDGRLARKLSMPSAGSKDAQVGGLSDSRPFRFLQTAEGKNLVQLLGNERPQTIALVISHLPPRQAGNVLVRLGPSLQVEVVRCLVNLEETDPEILQEVEQALESRLSEQILMQRKRVAGLTAVAGIIEASDRGVGIQILDNIASQDRQLAQRLGGPQQIEFDDLFQLDDVGLATVLGTADPQLVILALTGAPPSSIERILAKLPEREATIVRHELDHLGPTRLSDVEEARRRLAQLAQRLAVEQRIELPHKQANRLPLAA